MPEPDGSCQSAHHKAGPAHVQADCLTPDHPRDEDQAAGQEKTGHSLGNGAGAAFVNEGTLIPALQGFQGRNGQGDPKTRSRQ